MNEPIVSIFIDNIPILKFKNLEVISHVKKKLIVVFELVDIESISFYLGLTVS